MPHYFEFYFFAIIAALLGLYLALRLLFLWLGERKTQRENFYGYPFLREVRPNQRRRA